MKTAELITDILKSIDRLIQNIRKLINSMKKRKSKEKNSLINNI